jgi:hypothetical protein
MSRKITALIAGVVVSMAFLAGTMQGCGGGSGSGFSATCNAGCDKLMACLADAGTSAEQQVAACRASCNSTTQAHCTNEAAITAAIKSCTAMADCTAALTCAATIPDCQTSTGTAGTTGSAGTSGGGGRGGTGGSGSGWSCQMEGDACACAPLAGGPLATCGSYTCCVSFVLQGTTQQACACQNAAAADCTAVATGLSGTKVATCPPP